MSFAGEAMISEYIDAAAFMLAVGLLALSGRIRKRENDDYRLFFYMSVHLVIGCIVSFLHYGVKNLPPAAERPFFIISKTVLEVTILQMSYLWTLYVDCKLHGGMKKRKRRYHVLLISGICLFGLFIVNLFTGIVFTARPNMEIELNYLYYVIRIIYLLFFINSVIMVKVYDRESGKIRFFRVTPVIISVMTGTAIHFVSPYDCDMLGFAVGFTLLYFSMDSEILYIDRESGFYNLTYLTYVFSLTAMGKCDYHSALQFELKGNIRAGLEILARELADAGDVLRIEKNRYLIFSGKDSRSNLLLLSSVVEEAADSYNQSNPEEPVSIRAYSHIRSVDQEALEFMEEAVQNKEKGDSLQSVVSMMSELERLDNELRLAADIQINMLPMNFPAFPERGEFDLYAAMHPAKEVGGDFYDFFLVDEDHLALVIADVSGKGIPAALFMMVSKTMIKNNMMGGATPAETLASVNQQLCERNVSNMFVTVWLAVLEISTGKGISCNAGHENPIIRRKDSEFEVVKYRHDLFCGTVESVSYHDREFHVEAGEIIFVYTDGVVEAVNESNEQFGSDRLLSVLNREDITKPDRLIQDVQGAVERFANGAQQFDDITMLCLKYNGKKDQRQSG